MTLRNPNWQKVRALNDAFRASAQGGKIVFTSGVSFKGVAFSHHALALVRAFDGFTVDNDPWGEHDFGSLTVDGESLFWKIDYYDKAIEFHSPDPADPAETTRVLTIMLGEEY